MHKESCGLFVFFVNGRQFQKYPGRGGQHAARTLARLSRSLNGSSFPTQTVGADSIRPQPTKLSGWMNGKSVWLLPLGFPRGEAGFFVNRHFGTDCQKRLMRGSDTLSFQMSRLNGTNQNIYASHPTLSINHPFAAPHQSLSSVPKSR